MKRWRSFFGFFFHLIVNDILKQTNKYAHRFACHNLFDANRHLLLKRCGWCASPKPLLLTQIHICYSPAGRSVSRPLVHFFPIRTDLGWWMKFLFLPLNLMKSFPKELEWFTAVTISRSSINWTILLRLGTFSPKGNFRHRFSRPKSNSPQVVSLLQVILGQFCLKSSCPRSNSPQVVSLIKRICKKRNESIQRESNIVLLFYCSLCLHRSRTMLK